MLVDGINIWHNTGPEDAILTLQAAEIFNALGESESGAGEYTALIETAPNPDAPETSVAVRIGFLAGNHLREPMGWNECKAALLDAKKYLKSRDAEPQPD